MPQGFLFARQRKRGNISTRRRAARKSSRGRTGDEIYKKALEMTEKAPSLHAELQNQLAAQQRAQEAHSSIRENDRWWDSSVCKEGGEQADPDEFYYSMLVGTLCQITFSWLVMITWQASERRREGIFVHEKRTSTQKSKKSNRTL